MSLIKSFLFQFICVAMLGVVYGMARAEDPKLNSISKESIEALKGTVIMSATRKELQIGIVPPPGTLLNFDGPWQLRLKGNIPTRDERAEFDMKDYDKKKNKFLVPLDEKKSQVLSQVGRTTPPPLYQITYFLCSSDHTWCKREETQGPIVVKVRR